MKQARVVGPSKIEFEEVEKPTINENQVLVKTLYFGICGSDMSVYHGTHKYCKDQVVMGHEVSVEIVEVGANVKDFAVGDLVTVEPQLTCGECYPCITGRFNVCEHLKVMGIHADGFNAEYVAVDPALLHKAPQDMDPQLLTLVEPLAVGVAAVKRSNRLKGGNVLVIGFGTIGHFVAQAAKALGAGKVMVTDLNDDKLQYALECGMDYAINTGKEDLKEAIDKNFGKRKCDVIIDCVAHPAVFQQLLEVARPDSDIVVTGNFTKIFEFEVPLIQRREINILGHFMYVREDFHDAIDLLYNNKIEVSKTITAVYDFADYKEALQYIDDNPLDVMKILVKVAQD
ncbi:MAG TPA: zinc-binding dehydrogenase [Clostridiaceae bacterium]|nr:zinc-binding dehydrogenase [Clostridiaceae bacterium]